MIITQKFTTAKNWGRIHITIFPFNLEEINFMTFIRKRRVSNLLQLKFSTFELHKMLVQFRFSPSEIKFFLLHFGQIFPISTQLGVFFFVRKYLIHYDFDLRILRVSRNKTPVWFSRDKQKTT